MGDFFQRQEAVAVSPEVNEGSLEARLNPCDLGFVDVCLLLLVASCLNVEVVKPLSVDDGDPQLLAVSRVDQHSFHGWVHVSARAHNAMSGARDTAIRSRVRRVRRRARRPIGIRIPLRPGGRWGAQARTRSMATTASPTRWINRWWNRRVFPS